MGIFGKKIFGNFTTRDLQDEIAVLKIKHGAEKERLELIKEKEKLQANLSRMQEKTNPPRLMKLMGGVVGGFAKFGKGVHDYEKRQKKNGPIRF